MLNFRATNSPPDFDRTMPYTESCSNKVDGTIQELKAKAVSKYAQDQEF